MKFKSTLLVFALSLFVAFSGFASSTDPSGQPAKVEASASASPFMQLFQGMKTQLEEKASTEGLNAKEEKALERINKKISKLEAKQAKREAKGKKGGDKSWLAALILCWLLGVIGIHRFYLGYTWQGVVQLLTLGGLGIWTLIDFIRIIIRSLEPKDGKYTD